MQLKEIEQTFQECKAQADINELYQKKMLFTQRVSEMHKKLHAFKDNGNMAKPEESKADVIMIINSANTLLDFISDRIDIVRKKQLEEKHEKGLKNRFMVVCKKLMKPEEYQEFLAIAKRYSQEELEKMESIELLAK